MTHERMHPREQHVRARAVARRLIDRQRSADGPLERREVLPARGRLSGSERAVG